MKDDTMSIALLAAGVIGGLCFLTGLAMIYEPAVLLVLGGLLFGCALAIAYVRGSS